MPTIDTVDIKIRGDIAQFEADMKRLKGLMGTIGSDAAQASQTGTQGFSGMTRSTAGLAAGLAVAVTGSRNLKTEIEHTSASVTALTSAEVKADTATKEHTKAIEQQRERMAEARAEVIRATGNIGGLVNALMGGGGIAFAALAAGTAIETFRESLKEGIELLKEEEMTGYRVAAMFRGNALAIKEVTEQAEKLSSGSVFFRADQIETGMATLKMFNATEDQIKELTPALVDMATISGQSVDSMADVVGRGMGGMTRGLRSLGIAISEGASAQEVFDAVMANSPRFANAAKDAQEGLTGQMAEMKKATGEASLALAENFKPEILALMSMKVGFIETLSDWVGWFNKVHDAAARAASGAAVFGAGPAEGALKSAPVYGTSIGLPGHEAAMAHNVSVAPTAEDPAAATRRSLTDQRKAREQAFAEATTSAAAGFEKQRAEARKHYDKLVSMAHDAADIIEQAKKNLAGRLAVIDAAEHEKLEAQAAAAHARAEASQARHHAALLRQEAKHQAEIRAEQAKDLKNRAFTANWLAKGAREAGEARASSAQQTAADAADAVKILEDEDKALNKRIGGEVRINDIRRGGIDAEIAILTAGLLKAHDPAMRLDLEERIKETRLKHEREIADKQIETAKAIGDMQLQFGLQAASVAGQMIAQSIKTGKPPTAGDIIRGGAGLVGTGVGGFIGGTMGAAAGGVGAVPGAGLGMSVGGTLGNIVGEIGGAIADQFEPPADMLKTAGVSFSDSASRFQETTKVQAEAANKSLEAANRQLEAAGKGIREQIAGARIDIAEKTGKITHAEAEKLRIAARLGRETAADIATGGYGVDMVPGGGFKIAPGPGKRTIQDLQQGTLNGVAPEPMPGLGNLATPDYSQFNVGQWKPTPSGTPAPPTSPGAPPALANAEDRDVLAGLLGQLVDLGEKAATSTTKVEVIKIHDTGFSFAPKSFYFRGGRGSGTDRGVSVGGNVKPGGKATG